MFYADYKNNMGLNTHLVCDFFDGFIDCYESTPREDWESSSNSHWYPYDTIENLWNYYCSIDMESMDCDEYAELDKNMYNTELCAA